MEKNIRESLLLESYKELLTEKQREIMRLYVDCDVSLSEIADSIGSSRQAVYDVVKTAVAQLESYERRLKKVESAALVRQSLDLLDSCSGANISKVKKNLEKILKN